MTRALPKKSGIRAPKVGFKPIICTRRQKEKMTNKNKNTTETDETRLPEVGSGKQGKRMEEAGPSSTMDHQRMTKSEIAECALKTLEDQGISVEYLIKLNQLRWQQPKTTGKGNNTVAKPASFNTNNIYNNLTVDNISQRPPKTAKKQHYKENENEVQRQTKIKYPDVFAVGLEDPKKFIADLPKDLIYSISYKDGRIKFSPKDQNSHEVIFARVKAQPEAGGFTRTAPENRKSNMILKGVGYYVKTEEIETNLAEQGITSTVRRITSTFQRQAGRQGSIFSIMVKPGELEKLTAVEFVCDHRVNWELPYRRQSLQCTNCMRSRHTGGGCAFHTRCGHCGKDHFSKECNNQAKSHCVICGVDGHGAIDKGCPSKLEEMGRQEEQKEETQRRRLWELENQKRNQMISLSNIQDGVSFKQAISGKPAMIEKRDKELNSNSPQLEFGSFLEDTAQELFGISYEAYHQKVKRFKEYFVKLTDIESKKKAFANFVIQCA